MKNIDMLHCGIIMPLVTILIGCSAISTTQEINFYPIIKDSLSSRGQPAKLTNASSLTLSEKGYANLGVLEVKHVVERCQGSLGTPQRKCEKFPHVKSATIELLEEAGRRGGDLVALLVDHKESERHVAGQKCARWVYGESYSSMVYQNGRYVTGRQKETSCAYYEKVLTSERVATSMGIAYLYNPILAKQQTDLDEFASEVQRGDINKVAHLLDKGMRADQSDSVGYPFLYWAAESGNVAMADLLISRGGNVNVTGPAGVTPIHIAADKGHKDMVRYLITKRAQIDTRDDEDLTPLMYGARHGHTEVVRLLLELGADPNAKNKSGNTPLVFAVTMMPEKLPETTLDYSNWGNLLCQDPEIVRLLLVQGANPMVRNKAGKTPIDFALDERSEFGSAARFLVGYLVGAFGYIDRNGNWMVKPEYRWAYDFSEGLAAVSFTDLDGHRSGFIDQKGRMAISPRFRFVSDFSHGLAPASEDGEEWGYIDNKGAWVIAPQFKSAKKFSEGLAAVSDKNEKMGFIDREGKYIIKPQYDYTWYLRSIFSDGLALVTSGKQRGYIDKTGKWVISNNDYPTYEFGNHFSEGLVAFSDKSKPDKKKVGYMDKRGTVIIPPQFRAGMMFQDGLAAVWGDDSHGYNKYIDRSGKVVYERRWTTVGSFSEGVAMTMVENSGIIKGGQYDVSYIDKDGNSVLTLDYLKCNASWDKNCVWGYFGSSPEVAAGRFSEGMASVRVLGKKFLEIWSK